MYREFFKRLFIYSNDDMFEVITIINDIDGIDVNEKKKIFCTDTVFRKDGKLFFVNKIQEAQIITE